MMMLFWRLFMSTTSQVSMVSLTFVALAGVCGALGVCLSSYDYLDVIICWDFL